MKTAIISIHDVSPRFQTEIKVILAYFKTIPKSVLVTPLWDGVHHLTPDFVKMMQNTEGVADKVLHGLTHRCNRFDWLGKAAALSKRSDRELFGLTYQETEKLIYTSQCLFEDTFDEQPLGFIPPTWFHNAHSIDILHQKRFVFTETTWELVGLKHDVDKPFRHKTLPVCFDYGNNIVAEKLSIKAWHYAIKRFSPDLVRLSIHPSDVENGFLPPIGRIIETLKETGYEFLTYKDIFKNIKTHALNNNLYTE